MRLLKSASLIVVSVVSSTAIAGFNFDMELRPGHKEHKANPFPWSSFIHCTIETNEPSISIDATLTKGKGNVNGREMPTGNHEVFVTRNNDSFDITAGAYAEVDFQKLPSPSITEAATAHCVL